jgi:methionyl-tRNA formyltransferase
MSLRLVLVAPEEPTAMPFFFEDAVARLHEEIVAIAVVEPVYKGSSRAREARRFIEAFGVRDFLVEAGFVAAYRLSDAVRRMVPVGRLRSVKGIARAHGVPLLSPADVNAPAFLAELRALRPDLVISVSCPQIFKRELLELPSLGCVNVHSALLPQYRGMLPTFWALAHGETSTGVTLHFMTPGIDAGDIILQRRIPIGAGDTLHSLMRTCKQVAADLVVEAVGRFRDGTVRRLPNPPDEGSYFSFPQRADVREFRARGRRLR